MKIAYDTKLKRPGCVLLQAALGGSPIAHHFPTDSWLLAPTPDMKLYEITTDQLIQLIGISEKKKALR